MSDRPQRPSQISCVHAFIHSFTGDQWSHIKSLWKKLKCMFVMWQNGGKGYKYFCKPFSDQCANNCSISFSRSVEPLNNALYPNVWSHNCLQVFWLHKEWLYCKKKTQRRCVLYMRKSVYSACVFVSLTEPPHILAPCNKFHLSDSLACSRSMKRRKSKESQLRSSFVKLCTRSVCCSGFIRKHMRGCL